MLVLLIALAAIRLGLLSSGPTDKEAIKTALEEATQAAKEGRPGPVLDFVSAELRVNDVEEIDRAQIAKVVKESHPEVTVENQEAIVGGDMATIETPVRVSAQFMGGNSYEHEFKNVTLTF